MMNHKELLGVYVTNISLKATQKTVSDFFSFCGKINELSLQVDSTGQGQEAVVVFDSESAAKTALLLTNALIVDKVITVVQYTSNISFANEAPHIEGQDEQQQQQPQVAAVEGQEQLQSQNNVPADERSKTSVVASLIAAGYQLGSETATKARQFDDEHSLSLRIKVGAESAKASVQEFDQKFHISENAAAIKTVVVEKVGENATVVKTVVVEKAKQVDDMFQISDKFKAATDALSLQATSAFAKAQENQTVSSGVSFFSSLSTSIRNVQQSVTTRVQQQVQQISDETKTRIDEIDAEKKQQQPTENDSLLGQRGAEYDDPQQPLQPVVEINHEINNNNNYNNGEI
ncbi:RNA-binding region RNP-1 domain-containing protein [Cavenderia fasciculata]|uniref:RNA-binding region RNP-1 domain-containing protein n=1 Tax=Cavenderia fasciculata TaxID=261658 RepID=F4PSI3_CACFS|nr:RNA-binding region RNP-1 domain-containing protein [Cavenderia fasciculata]EGG21513.1 RNA-binding region RNP-1 domain-containing protein [Cavenderia fasciculata]|eukprot:XP_004359363.1 RNA-binding region RNP-1 domain-containing protein [Cavenderia fasciculata]